MRMREKLSPQELRAVKVCLRGKCNGMSFDSTSRLVTVQVGAFGGEQGASDPTAKPQTISDVPVAFPYGFLSMLPAGDAYEPEVLETAAGLLCVSTRSALPSACPTPSDGDSLQYSSGGSYTHHDADGDTVVEPNDGSVIKAGSGAAQFAARADLVLQEIDDLRKDVNEAMVIFNTHTHAAGAIVDSSNKSCTGSTETPSASMVQPSIPSSVACTKLKVE